MNWLIFNDSATNQYAHCEHEDKKHVIKEPNTDYCTQCTKKDEEIARLKKEIDTFVRVLDMLDRNDKQQSQKAS